MITSIRGPLLSPAAGGLLAVRDAVIRWDAASGRIGSVLPAPARSRADLELDCDHLIVPGFVDAHVHFPQYTVRGRFSGALLPWLREHIWPEEERFGDPAVADAEAPVFLAALASAGTTTASVYGSPHPISVPPLFGHPVTVVAGPALMDSQGPDGLLLGPPEAEAAMNALVGRFGRAVVVTPRFAVSCTASLLEVCGRLAARHALRVQTHLSENPDEIALVGELFPDARDYLDVYERAGLLKPGTLLAHAVHCSDDAYRRIAAARAWIVHCPTSNEALHSGRMPVERIAQLGPAVCLGSDVGAGPDLCMLDVLRCFVAIHEGRHPVHAEVTLPLATRAGAEALGLLDRGALTAGQRADLVVLQAPGAGQDPGRAFDELVRAYDPSTPTAPVVATFAGGSPVFGP